MTGFDDSTSSNNQPIRIKQDPAWCTLTCEECGEEYKDLRILADIGRDLCHDCRDPGPLKVGNTSLVGGNSGISQAFDRPLMEHGPLSFTRGDEL